MPNFISKTELETQTKDQKVLELTHQVGEIYPQIFSHVTEEDLNELHTAIILLGAYKINSNLFKKQTCPKCGRKHSLTPYMCGGSVLSGAHTIQFYCTNCHEQFVTNNFKAYFKQIYEYVKENKKDLPVSKKFLNCSQTDENANSFDRFWRNEVLL